MIKEEIRQIEERQLELLSIMKMSDEHAAKCSKLGNEFKKEYPTEYLEYVKANKEYNENETKLLVLQKQNSEDEIIKIETE